MKFNFLNLFRSKETNQNLETEAMDADALNFDGLNPVLAKQLSELETQMGQFAQVQFELSQERERMRSEMDALRKAVQKSQNETPNEASAESTGRKTEIGNEAT